MKKFFKALMAVALIGSAVPASAQFTGGKSGGSSSSAANTESYNRISLSYDNTHLGPNNKLNKEFNGYFCGEDAMSLNGVGLEYTHGFSLSNTLPMFIEAGIKAQFSAGSIEGEKSYDGQTLKAQRFSFIVPVNYTYRIPIGDGMSIAPFLGINLKLHAMGRQKTEFDDYDNDWDDDDWDYYTRYYDDDYDYDYDYDDYDPDKWSDIFNKKDMGSKDNTWNRFQMGWQIGVGFNFKAFYIGLQYGTDFISAYKHKKYAVNSGNFALKVGYNF